MRASIEYRRRCSRPSPLLGRSPGKWWPLLRWYLAAAAGIGVVYAVMAVDGRLRLWAAAGLDYSTHFAFATSLVVSLEPEGG